MHQVAQKFTSTGLPRSSARTTRARPDRTSGRSMAGAGAPTVATRVPLWPPVSSSESSPAPAMATTATRATTLRLVLNSAMGGSRSDDDRAFHLLWVDVAPEEEAARRRRG